MKEANQEIEQELAGFVQQAANHFDALTPETDLLAAGLLDSMMLMDLVLFIEERWGLKLSPYDISTQNFSTIARLQQLIESRLLQTTNQS